MKIVLDNKEELHDIEDRLQKAVDCVLESNSKLRSSERKLIRSQLTQLTSCLTLKVQMQCSAPHALQGFCAFYLLHLRWLQ
jgi:vacuolar-type H+-ATPase subunit H